MRARAAAAALLAAGLLAAPGPTAAAPGRSVVLRDRPCGDAALGACDALQATLTPEGGGLRVEVILAAPPDRRLYTAVNVTIDGDRNPKTGVGGCELWFRAAIGTRFGSGPGDVPAGPPPGGMSWSYASVQETVGTAKRDAIWRNRFLDGVPTVEGKTIRFTIPKVCLEKTAPGTGEGYDANVGLETWTGDRPLLVEHVAFDDGLPIVADGDDRDWSGAPEATDPGGEVFPPLARLDLRRLRVDHGPKALFACVDLDRPGFADRPDPGADLVAGESITVLAEPVDSDYERPRRVVITRGQASGETKDGSFAVKDRTVEVAFPSTGLDGRVRVLAWSAGWRKDWIPDQGSVRVGGR